MGLLHKENKHQVHYHGDGLKNLLIGVGLGAAIAWLFTTKEGEMLRKKVLEEEGDVAEKLKEFFAEFQNQKPSPIADSARTPVEPMPTKQVPVSVAQLYEEEAPRQEQQDRVQPWMVQQMEASPQPEPVQMVRQVTMVATSNDQLPQEQPMVTQNTPLEPESSTEEADAALRAMRQRRFFRRVR
jgi:hypothetical protein